MYEESLNRMEKEVAAQEAAAPSREEMPDLGLGQKQLVKFLVQNNKVDKDLKKELWAYLNNKEAALTFLNTQEVISLLNEYDETVLMGLMNKFPDQFSARELQNANQGRSALKLKLTRSRGEDGRNERTLQATQIDERSVEVPTNAGSGILSGVKSMFGMGGNRR